MATVDDNNFDIPYLTGNDTFLDWVNHYNNYAVEKLNKIRIYDGVSGDGVGLTLGTTADGTTWGGVFRVDLNDTITKGITFSDDITIQGTLNLDGGETIASSNGWLKLEFDDAQTSAWEIIKDLSYIIKNLSISHYVICSKS